MSKTIGKYIGGNIFWFKRHKEFIDQIKMVKTKCKDCLSAEDLRMAAKKLQREIKGDKDK